MFLEIFITILIATNTICYLTFALFQIITLILTNGKTDMYFFDYALYWLIGVSIFIIIEKQIYNVFDDQRYSYFSKYFLYCREHC